MPAKQSSLYILFNSTIYFLLLCYNLITYIPNRHCFQQWRFLFLRLCTITSTSILYFPLHSDSFKTAATCVQVSLRLLNLLIDIILVSIHSCAILRADDDFSVKHDFNARFRLTTLWTGCPVCHLVSHLLKNIYLTLSHLVIDIAECLKCCES